MLFFFLAREAITSETTELREAENLTLACRLDKKAKWFANINAKNLLLSHQNEVIISNASKINQGWIFCIANSVENLWWSLLYIVDLPQYSIPKKALLRGRVYIKVICK